MRYRVGFLLLYVCLRFSLAGTASAQSSLTVSESAIRMELASDGVRVALPVTNDSSAAVTAGVSLQLVSPLDNVDSQWTQTGEFPPGKTDFRAALPPISPGKPMDAATLAWYRLRYSIGMQSPERAANHTSGIVSVGGAVRDLFELHVAGAGVTKVGGSGIIVVRAVHPVTLHPIAGVKVQASLDVDADDGKPALSEESTTNQQGYATLRYSIPAEVDEDEIDVTVTGKLGNLTATAERQTLVDNVMRMTVSTDKFLYQPGQTVHVRMMGFDPNRKALEDRQLSANVYDPDDTLVFHGKATTSRFGVATVDWPVPGNLRLGTYTIRVSDRENGPEDRYSKVSVKISRYDLPNFAVRVKPDRAYYLPGQDADVEVAADYLFGQPVTRGHVRVVRETQREWNFREQKWETKTGATYEGDSDSQGRYIAHLDLAGEHEQLAGNDYERFYDLDFTVYFTDSSTGKTEEKRFDVRVTKEPIHIYPIGLNWGADKGLPLEFYLSADYADGTPAECDIDIDWPGTSAPWPKNRGALPGPRFLRRVHSNRYGIAKVTGLNLPIGDDIDSFDLTFRARDRKGLTGRHTESVMFREAPGIVVKTDKALYAPGDSIGVELTTREPVTTVVVEATHAYELIERRFVNLRRGHGFLVLSPDRRFQNEVSVAAYYLGSRHDTTFDGIVGFKTVYFPKPQGLDVDVRLSKTSFKPGEEASASLHISGPGGSVKQGALGLVVVDRAVEERAEQDDEYTRGSGFFGSLREQNSEQEIQGVKLSDLDKLDLSKPLRDGMELVAEALLSMDRLGPVIFGGGRQEDLSKLFQRPLESVLVPVRDALDERYRANGRYPTNESALETELAEAGIRLQELRDPWGMPYHASFRVRNDTDVLDLASGGPDKTFGNDDDFNALEISRPYFKPMAEAIQHAVNEFHARTGGFIRDETSLRNELLLHGIDLASLKDRWGHAYRFDFGVDRTKYTVTVRSAGPDGRFDTESLSSDDDFALSTATIDYFAELNAHIDSALNDAYNRDHAFPSSAEELRQLLLKAGIHWDELRDPWGHPYYATFRQQAMYADDVRVETYQDYLGKTEQHTSVTPVTRLMNYVYLRSAGEDGVEGTADDFYVAAFSRYEFQESAAGPSRTAAANSAVLSGATGAISGTVQDQTGGAISGADVTARQDNSPYSVSVRSGEDGAYLLRNLPAGLYTVEVFARGFRATRIEEVPVHSSTVTPLTAVLSVGEQSQTVTVTESVPLVETTSAALIGVPGQTKIGTVAQPVATPRLRAYFPETLYWQPELVTDKNGRAQIRFPLADNITTWKLSVIASTEEGEIGMAEKEIRAFQPFFAEHDPPRFLTASDEIDLPVVLRNYLDRDLTVTTNLKPEAWFTALGPASVKTNVPRRDSAPAVFKFRAAEPVRDGRQRITASAADTGDAIERKVTVRPNGEELAVSTSQILSGATQLEIRLPDETIPGSADATLKIYPNLQAHLLESINAIRQRPYGCAEQIISSTYPSLLLLRYAQDGRSVSPVDLAQAKRDLELGYQKLLADLNIEGGVTYWGRGEADTALTAYAMKFLSDAGEFLDTNDSAAEKPLRWLIHSARRENGRWISLDWQGKEDPRRSVLLTAYVARMIAAVKMKPDGQRNAELEKQVAETMSKTLAYLEPEVRRVDEPYILASYGLAALGTGNQAAAKESVDRLLRLEHREGDFSYWSLEMNTPFYGWGLAGRIETTALVLQLFSKAGGAGNEIRDLSSRGLLFLLRNEDRFGVWYSTQATINVLDTIASLTATGESRAAANTPPRPPKAAILVDGKEVQSVDLPNPSELAGPIYVDVSSYISAGAHTVEIDREAASTSASAQLAVTYFVPWTAAASAENVARPEKSSEALRLNVHFDKPSAQVGDTIDCTVSAERAGFRGYGMMLAEIGLPPGADVDRATLDKAMAESNWSIQSYDVLPDRLIVYLWPRAGGTSFSFAFKPRFGIRALSAPSILYDYYNPDARAVTMPVAFIVR